MSTRAAKLKKGSVRFSKFTIVGFFNAVVDIGTLNLFLWFASTRDPSVLALYNGVALVLANGNSYLWNTRWTFKGRAKRRDPRQRTLFAVQALFNICVSNGLFYALIHPVLVYTDVPAYLAGNVAKLISVAVASTISFFLLRYVVFSRKRRFGGRL
ncbi:MAG TPA: GtrA family protein [Rubrobacteraceae bacterium]|jgi:putative flippase GtrA|nr:GtrA family protein [Rubrobacteraceae bacterium]